MLPDSNVWGGTILAIVHQNNPKSEVSMVVHGSPRFVRSLHSVWVHGLADVEIVVLEVTDDLLGVTSSTLLELGDLLIGSSVGLHGLLDLLHVSLKVGEVRLLVELGRLETERVDDVVDLDGTLLKSLLSLLGGSVGTGVWLIVLDSFSQP